MPLFSEIPGCIYLPSVDSSNSAAKQLAAQGCPHGTTVIAGEQTKGRGRYGRSFSSEPGGLYMSVVLRLEATPAETAPVTAAAAVAVCQAIENVTGMEPRIKWVNDILLREKKNGGILCETVTVTENAAIPWVVAGVGINMSQESIPDELLPFATGLYQTDPGDETRVRLAVEIWRKLCAPPRELLEYRRRLSTLGRVVGVHTPEGIVQAFAEDIDDQCRLLVSLPDGTRRVLFSGEASIRHEVT